MSVRKKKSEYSRELDWESLDKSLPKVKYFTKYLKTLLKCEIFRDIMYMWKIGLSIKIQQDNYF